MRVTAPGKIILCGEYAVVFGYPGIAVPSPVTMTVSFEEDPNTKDLTIEWADIAGHREWQHYLKQIIHACGRFGGTLTIENDIPLGRGMGSSTALVIAICKCLLGKDCEKRAREIEDIVNPGNSGIDFAVIWNKKPVLLTKGSEPKEIHLPDDLLKGALLIDTGMPNEQTPELVRWITEQKEDMRDILADIGTCADRLQNGEDFAAIIRDHNAAQQSLGVVTKEAKELITKIEQEGGSAKVIGAGGRTGGCGMILAVNTDASVIPTQYPVIVL